MIAATISLIRKHLAQRRQKAAQRALAADVAQRRLLVGQPYQKRREAALRGLGL